MNRWVLLHLCMATMSYGFLLTQKGAIYLISFVLSVLAATVTWKDK